MNIGVQPRYVSQALRSAIENLATQLDRFNLPSADRAQLLRYLSIASVQRIFAPPPEPTHSMSRNGAPPATRVPQGASTTPQSGAPQEVRTTPVSTTNTSTAKVVPSAAGSSLARRALWGG